MASNYKPERMSVAASGVFHEDLEGIVKLLEFEKSTHAPSDKKAWYVGGKS